MSVYLEEYEIGLLSQASSKKKKSDEVYSLQNSTEQELSVEIIWNAESNRKMGK